MDRNAIGSDRTKLASGVLGVLGGMGPAATADFYMKLVRATPAANDQDHIPVVIVADPRIADRSHAIETGLESEVLYAMLRRVRRLECAGVDAIAIPCNTAHFWLPGLKAETDIPFINLIEAAVLEARRRFPDSSRALVLGTRATVISRIYDAELERAGFEVFYPNDRQQAIVDALIASVKTGFLPIATRTFAAASRTWLDQAEVVLLACTELPLAAIGHLELHSKLIDTTAALVNACVAWATAKSGNAARQSF